MQLELSPALVQIIEKTLEKRALELPALGIIDLHNFRTAVQHAEQESSEPGPAYIKDQFRDTYFCRVSERSHAWVKDRAQATLFRTEDAAFRVLEGFHGSLRPDLAVVKS